MRIWTLAMKAFWHGCVELLLFFPPLLLAAVYAIPGGAGWLWAASLPLAYAAGAAAAAALPLGRLDRLLAAMAALGAAHACATLGVSLPAAPAAVLGALLAYRGARLYTVPGRALFPVGFYVIGLLLYFVTSGIFRFVESFQPYMTALMWTGLLALAVTLFATNQATVKQEALPPGQERPVAGTVLWQNRFLIAVLFAIMLIAALFGQLKQAAEQTFRLLISAVMALISLFPASAGGETRGPDPALPPPGLDPGQPAAWLQWLEKAAVALAAVAVAAAAAFLLYVAGRKLAALAKRLYGWLLSVLDMGEKPEEGAGYVDDVESLIRWKELRDELGKRLFRRRGAAGKPLPWEQLQTNGERVRYLYRSLLSRSMAGGYVPKPYYTPRETGSDIAASEAMSRERLDPLIGLYERVRYGGEEVGDRELREAKERLERPERPG